MINSNRETMTSNRVNRRGSGGRGFFDIFPKEDQFLLWDTWKNGNKLISIVLMIIIPIISVLKSILLPASLFYKIFEGQDFFGGLLNATLLISFISVVAYFISSI